MGSSCTTFLSITRKAFPIYYCELVPFEDPQSRLREVRDETAELASYGRHGAESFNDSSANPRRPSVGVAVDRDVESEPPCDGRGSDGKGLGGRFRPDLIEEISEPSSADTMPGSKNIERGL